MALRWSARIEFSPGYRHAAPLERGIATWRRSLSQSLSIPLISDKGPVDGRRGRESRLGEDLYGISIALTKNLYRARYSLT